MKAILKDDIIIRLVDPKSDVGVDVGDLPLGAPLDFNRIRWNGTSLVDLMTFDEIYVRRVNGVWTLHSVEVEGSQLVTMKYWRKKFLIDDSGTYRVMTGEEIDQHKTAQKADKLENRELRAAAKEFVQELTFQDINTIVDNLFGGLSVGQRNYLKKLSKGVLYLAKDKVRGRS
jgi:hypothetical protein